MVEGLIEEAVVGKTYTGRSSAIMDFGAFVEILPGKEGLVTSPSSPPRASRTSTTS